MPVEKTNIRLSPLSQVKWEHLVAGVSGGVLSTLVLHPLDLVKVRFQVNEGTAAIVGAARPEYNGVLNALNTIRRTNGMLGLYQGVAPNLLGTGASWGLYFMLYNSLKQRLLDKHRVTTLEPHQHMLAATQTGIITLILTNPIWVIKTRLCLQYDGLKKSVATGKQQYRGMLDCLLKIYKYEGVQGLYKGFIPGVVGVSHGALQFMTYEEMKKLCNKYKGQPLNSKLNTTDYIAFSALSKVIAASATYPYQVVRSRLQDQHRNYAGIMDVIKQTWKMEKIGGFYKGIVPSLIHVIPNICIVFLVYEKVSAYFDPGVKSDSYESRPIKTKFELTRIPNIDQVQVVPIRVKQTGVKDKTMDSETLDKSEVKIS